MSINDAINWVNTLASQHAFLALVIIFLLAFGESLAFISLLLPATVILLGLGAVLGESSLVFWHVWLSATLGAFMGDWLSWWLGYHYKERVQFMWPLSRKPELFQRGHAFFIRWGGVSIFFGRFFGPLRAVVPLISGICAMRLIPFQIANAASAALWAFGILAPGVFGVPWLMRFFD